MMTRQTQVEDLLHRKTDTSRRSTAQKDRHKQTDISRQTQVEALQHRKTDTSRRSNGKKKDTREDLMDRKLDTN